MSAAPTASLHEAASLDDLYPLLHARSIMAGWHTPSAESRQAAYGHRKAKADTQRGFRFIGDIRTCRGASSAAPPPPGRAGAAGAATARAAGSSLAPRKRGSAHSDKRRR
jgi:hypothetical protein